MQTYLFEESKASELNFEEDLEEKVTKAVQSKKNSNSNKQARTNRIHSNSRLALPSPAHVERTSAWRVVRDGPQPLFLAIQAPHKAMSSAIIGRWLKDIMKEAGIDVDTSPSSLVRLLHYDLPFLISLSGSSGDGR